MVGNWGGCTVVRGAWGVVVYTEGLPYVTFRVGWLESVRDMWWDGG